VQHKITGVEVLEKTNGSYDCLHQGRLVAVVLRQNPLGYRVMTRDASRLNGSGYHPTPEEAVFSYFGSKGTFYRLEEDDGPPTSLVPVH
jgi:hypothetical protein